MLYKSHLTVQAGSFLVFCHKRIKKKYAVIKHINDTRSLGLSEAEMKNFVRTPSIGVPFSGLKQLLSIPQEDQKNFKQPGVPLDTLGGELLYWIRDAVGTFTGKKLQYLIKGDNNAKYPAFKQVLTAFKKNEIFKFQMITMLEDAPAGSELAILRNREKAASK